jgi:hypothetical protein
MGDRDLVLRRLAPLDSYLGQLAQYRELDPAIVVRVLRSDLIDIERFRDAGQSLV